MAGTSHLTQQRADLEQSFNTYLPNAALPSDLVKLGTTLQLLMLALFSLDTSQDLPLGLLAQLSANNVTFNISRLNKWDTYVAKQARFREDASLADEEKKKKVKSIRANNQKMKKDLIATAAPKFNAFFQAASTAIARVTGEAAVQVDNSDTFDSISNGSTKANNQRQANRKVDEAVVAHDAVVEFVANNDMSSEENQTKRNKLMMLREELSSKRGASVFDGMSIDNLLKVAIEQQKLMLVPVDPNTDYGPGLDEERRLLQKSINIAIAAEKATAKKTALEGDDSDDDCSITSDSCGESGMPIAMKMESMSTYTHQPMTVVSTGTSRKIESFPFAFDEDVSASGMSTMKMESTSTKPMTVVSTGTSHKKTCPFASATSMSLSDEDATLSSRGMDMKKSSPLLRKKPFPNENSSNFNVSTAQSSMAFGDSDDSDNEKIHYRRSSTSTKNKSILDSDDEAMDSKLPPMKKRARSTNKKRKKLGYKYN